MTATKKTETKKSEATAPKSLKDAAAQGTVKLVRQRKNGTFRHLPYLAKDSDLRKEAEAVAARRAKGETINAIAEDLKSSVATVRRMITNLQLAHEIEAGEHADKWTPGEKQVVICVVDGKLP